MPGAWSVRRDFVPRPVSSHKGLPTDDVVPCLLRPICFSAISVAAIARSSLLSLTLPLSLFLSPLSFSPFVVCVLQRARVRAMADGACVCVCVLSWLNSRSAGTNYNEPRLVGRESAMFSFLCPVVYRPFYRGHPFPPSFLPPRYSTLSSPLSRLTTLEPDLLLRPSSPSAPPNPNDDTSTRLSSTPSLPRDLLTMRNPPGGGKKFQLFETGTKEAARKCGRNAWRRIACATKRYIA